MEVNISLQPDGVGNSEITVKNSRFIGRASGVNSEKEAREVIKQTRERHPGSTHVAYAFMVGGKSREICGMSDDGEPKGTAGRAILDSIRRKGIVNVLVTVVRYFGGVKLGAGGLTRVYRECALEALKNLHLKALREEVEFSLEIGYESYESALRVIGDAGGAVTREEFTTLVRLRGLIPSSNQENFISAIKNLTSGRAGLEISDHD